MLQSPATLFIAGRGNQLIEVRLGPVHYMRGNRGGEEFAPPFLAASLSGADFDGSLSDLGANFEANSYAPAGYEDYDGDDCLLASFEFHHVTLTGARRGIYRFTAQFAGANTYDRGVYARMAAGEAPEAIAEMANTDDGPRMAYLPPASAELAPFRGWTASITVSPLPAAG